MKLTSFGSSSFFQNSLLKYIRSTVMPFVVHIIKSFHVLQLVNNIYIYIIESVDSISKDERGFPLTQYITNGRISRDGYTLTHFKHDHRVLRLISYRMGV